MVWDPKLRGTNIKGTNLKSLGVCTLGFWVPKPWNMALNKGIWDPKLRGTNIKGTNLKSLIHSALTLKEPEHAQIKAYKQFGTVQTPKPQIVGF